MENTKTKLQGKGEGGLYLSLLPPARLPTLLPDYSYKVTSYFILLLSCLPRQYGTVLSNCMHK